MPPPPVTSTFDLLIYKVVSGVKCNVGYLCANASLPGLLCSRHRPDVCDAIVYGGHKKRSFIRLRYIEWPKISKLGHVAQATAT